MKNEDAGRRPVRRDRRRQAEDIKIELFLDRNFTALESIRAELTKSHLLILARLKFWELDEILSRLKEHYIEKRRSDLISVRNLKNQLMQIKGEHYEK